MRKKFLLSTKKHLGRSNPGVSCFPDIDAAITSVIYTGGPEGLPFCYKQSYDDIILAISCAAEEFDFVPQEIFHGPFVTSQRGGNSFDFIDLFAGIGGFRSALQDLGGRCVFSSEWDRAAKETYLSNYGEVPFGDINQYAGIDVSDEDIAVNFPDHDILAGGFPCQPFSNAGVSARGALGLAHGFECETQGTLFYVVARIANVKRPQVLFLENVRNLVSHDNGQTFDTIKKTIEKIGYRFHYEVIDSSSLVPQRRKRCYMICVREDICAERGEFIFPEFEGQPRPLRDALDANPDISYTISDRLWKGHINRTKRNLARGTGFTAHVADLDKPSNTIVARYGKDGKECLIPQEGRNPRKLTISECKKLFGFPEDFITPQAKTPTYKQFGNSVVMPVIGKIGSATISQYL